MAKSLRGPHLSGPTDDAAGRNVGVASGSAPPTGPGGWGLMVAVTFRATCALMAVIGLDACTSTLVGRGSSVAVRGRPIQHSVVPSGSRAVPGSSAPPPPSTSCTAATCRQVASASLTNDYVVVLWAGKSSAVDPTSVVELTRGGLSSPLPFPARILQGLPVCRAFMPAAWS